MEQTLINPSSCDIENRSFISTSSFTGIEFADNDWHHLVGT